MTSSLKATQPNQNSSRSNLHRLKRFLGIIASLAPLLLHGDIVNDAASLISIYNIIRSYYQLAPSK